MTRAEQESAREERFALILEKHLRAMQPIQAAPQHAAAWDILLKIGSPIIAVAFSVYVSVQVMGEQIRQGKENADKVEQALKASIAETKQEMTAKIAVVEAARIVDHDKLIAVEGKEASLRDLVQRNEIAASARATDLAKQMSEVGAIVRQATK